MATKPDAAAAVDVVAPARSKKLLVVVAGIVVLVAVLAGGAFYFLKQRAAADEEGGDGASSGKTATSKHAEPGKPPVYLPMDPMVVNLRDPGGERVAQIGLILEVADSHASDTVKAFLPTIRSAVLMQIRKRTADELLSNEGIEKLQVDILREASVPFGGGEDENETSQGKGKKKPAVDYPVKAVRFSNLIIQ